MLGGWRNTVVRWRTAQRSIAVVRQGDSLVIEADLAPPNRLCRVLVVPRGDPGQVWWAGEPDPASGRVVLPLPELLRVFESHRSGATPTPGGRPKPLFATAVLELVGPAFGTLDAPARTGLSGFRSARVCALTSVASAGGVLTAYVSAKGNLTLRFGDDVPPVVGSGSVTRIRDAATSWELRGTLDPLNAEVDGGELVLVGRRTDDRITVPAAFTEVADHGLRHHGHRRYRFRATIRDTDLLGRFVRPELLDAHFLVRASGIEAPLEVPLRRVAPSARLDLPGSVFSDGDRAVEVRAYRTFKARAFALEVRPIDADAAAVAQAPLRHAVRLRLRSRRHPVWLVGERPETAQDTGLALFEYLRDNHPEIDARYVIAADSPDRDRLGDSDVVLFGSREHVESTLAASRIISSHHADYLLATRRRGFQRAVRARRVFLQHGIMGTKNMVRNYGYDAPGFTAEQIIVSSDRERRMIEEDFGWPARRVALTGLSRHDRLFGEGRAPERRLLIMPTWRDWLRSAEDVVTSEFAAEWHALLDSPEFSAFLVDNDLEADFYLHANMQAYSDLLTFPNVNLLRHGDLDVQDLLLRSMVMLTDYTSAAIDFSFLDRPVVYYQFDRSRFLGPRPSHFDLDAELPGEIAMTPAEVMDALRAAAAREFTISPEARRKATALTRFRDTGARERIVEAVRATPRRRLIPPMVRDLMETSSRVAERARKDRRYVRVRDRVRVPLVRRAYGLARRLPRSGAIVLESNLGRDTGDSPRAIFDELVRRGSDRSLRWVVTGGVAAPDGATGLVRGSLRYVWALGRASVWIDNQNMPSWMRRPEATVYVQTWHGTPLKRMLHDLDEIVGRDEGYVDRVDTMIGEWSYLLSPSAWATERFRSALRYDGEVLELGYPRNDVLADDRAVQRATQVRRRLGLARSKKVLVYAPTFRDDQRVGTKFRFSIALDLERLLAAVGTTHEIIVRLHPIVRGKVRLPRGVHNGALGGISMEDLLATADVLVTDYSSVMFDFAVTGRPMAFFVPDLAHYRDELRGFYLDFEKEAPGPLVEDTDGLIEVLRDPEGLAAYEPMLTEFRRRFCPLDDGHAAERVVDRLVADGVPLLPRITG